AGGIRVVVAVLHVHDHAAAADHVPVDHRVDVAVLRHQAGDPRGHRGAAAHLAVDVLDVVHVLGEARRPRGPVLVEVAHGPQVLEGGLDLGAGGFVHAATVPNAAYDLPFIGVRVPNRPCISSPGPAVKNSRPRTWSSWSGLSPMLLS